MSEQKAILGSLACVSVFACALVFDEPKRPESPRVPGTGEQIAAFARERIGTKVGNGQCTSLVVDALRSVEAECCPSPNDGDDYVWGKLIEKRAEAQAGDIIQFTDLVLSGRRKEERKGKTVRVLYRTKYAHHTAIVEAIRDEGREIAVLHQNVGPEDASDDERQRVQRSTIRAGDLKSGTMKIYRPIARNVTRAQSDLAE